MKKIVAVKWPSFSTLPECCEECQYFETRPHPSKGYTDSCALCMKCLDDSEPDECIYDGESRPKICPLVEITE